MAIDPDGTPIALDVQVGQATELPSWAAFTDNGNGSGVLRVSPMPGNRDDYLVTVTARETTGNQPLRATSQFILQVTSENEPPRFTPFFSRVVLADQSASFPIRVTDVDQDALSIVASGLPTGATVSMSSIYGEATFSWSPTAADIGDHTISFTVTDSGNGDPSRVLSDSRTVTLHVRTSNTRPSLEPIGEQTIAEGSTLVVQMQAEDLDGDELYYSAGQVSGTSLSNLPRGAQFDVATGRLTWTPDFTQAGSYRLRMTVSDGVGSRSEDVLVNVIQTNQSPVFSALPKFFGREGEVLFFAVDASDADGQPLVYSLESVGGDWNSAQLPPGLRFDSVERALQWQTNFQAAGNYVLNFVATDPDGASDKLEVEVQILATNRAPTLQLPSFRNAEIGQELAIEILALDPDGDVVSLTAGDLPAGATLGSDGILRWAPQGFQAGQHTIRIIASDGEMAVRRNITLQASFEPASPNLRLVITPSFPAVPGQRIVIEPIGDSDVALGKALLFVDGQELALDDLGRGLFVPSVPGRYEVVSSIADAEGRETTTTQAIFVRDPADRASPEIVIEEISPSVISEPRLLTIDIGDDTLAEYVIELVPRGIGKPIEISRGSNNVCHQATLDPSRFVNGFYTLRVTARDLGGLESVATTEIEINSSTKVGSFEQLATDLSVTLAGVPVEFARYYSSLTVSAAGTTANNKVDLQGGSLGSAWTLPMVNPQVAISATIGEGSFGVEPLRRGDRLYLSLPTGQRVGFSFVPRLELRDGIEVYHPEWVPDSGVQWHLSSYEKQLQQPGDDEAFYVIGSGLPYNLTLDAGSRMPVSTLMLQSPNGITYGYRVAGETELGPRFVLERIVSADEQSSLRWTDSGLVAPDGQRVAVVRNADGRIQELVGPSGQQIVYHYDAEGRLSIVVDMDADVRQFYSYNGNGQLVITAHSSNATLVNNFEDSSGEFLGSSLGEHLGSTRQFIGNVIQEEIPNTGFAWYSFTITDGELLSSTSGSITLGFEITSPDFDPSAVSVLGVPSGISAQESGRSVALFTFRIPGTYALSVSSQNGSGNAGSYAMHSFLVGDVNQDFAVNGFDQSIFENALGSREGEPEYIVGADSNRDGFIDNQDRDALLSGYGFIANVLPQGMTTNIVVRQGELVSISLKQLISDFESDKLSYRIASVGPGVSASIDIVNESLLLSASTGLDEATEVELIADDGMGRSELARVFIQPSRSQLVHLALEQDRGVLNEGEAQRLDVFAEYDDGKTLLIDGRQINWSVSNESIVQIHGGYVVGISSGAASAIGELDGLKIPTAWMVGAPDDIETIATAVLNLDVYPHSVLLPSGESRQLKVSLSNQEISSFDNIHVTFTSSDPRVVRVDANGLISAVGLGEAEVMVLGGAGLKRIPVSVHGIEPSGALVGTEGGIVGSSTTGWVQIAPGLLGSPQVITLTSLDANTLPEVQEDVMLGAAFHLDIGESTLSNPVQIAYPVTGIAPGETVFFQRASQLVTADGDILPIWLQDEFGVVGVDGIARTSSPPSSGVRHSGDITVINPIGDRSPIQASVTLIRGDFTNYDGVVVTTSTNFGVTGTALDFLSGGAVTGLFGNQHQLTMFLPPGETEFELWVVRDGLAERLAVATADPAKQTELDFVIDGIPTPSIAVGGTPLIERVSFELLAGETGLTRMEGVIEGQNLFVPSPAGYEQVDPSQIELRITAGTPDEFDVDGNYLGGLQDIVLTGADLSYEVLGGKESIRFQLPSGIPVGLMRLQVARPVSVVVSESEQRLEHIESVPFQVSAESRFAFAAATQANKIVVAERATDEVGVDTFELTLEPSFARPLSTLVSGDRTRVYVSLTEPDAIAVYDAVTLTRLDADGDLLQDSDQNPTTIRDNIALPISARVDRMTIDPRNEYLYAADSIRGSIYVIDLRTDSPTYHRVIQTIAIPDAPYGLRGLAITSDGQDLVVAVPGHPLNRAFVQAGHIVIVDLRETEFPNGSDSDGNRQTILRPQWQPVVSLQAGPEPYGVTATSDPNTVLFTDRRSDGVGYNILNRDLRGNWTIRSFPALLGDHQRINLDTVTLRDPLDVDNLNSIELIPGRTDYAFVSAYNANLSNDAVGRMGGNIGIIADPLGLTENGPHFVAATEHQPVSLPDNLALGGDGSTLFVTMQGTKELLAYDIPSIFAVIDQAQKTGYDLTRNSLERAAIQLFGPDTGILVDRSRTVPVSSIRGADSIVDSLKLIAPVNAFISESNPIFQWDVGIAFAKSYLYISTFPSGNGLYPTDLGSVDLNPYRILTAYEVTADENGTATFTLPDELKLTSGQTYYWGVEAPSAEGRVVRKASLFHTNPVLVESADQFSAVTVITHGFTPDPYTWFSDNALENTPDSFIDMARLVAQRGGDGVVMIYNRATGLFVSLDGRDPVPGRPLVLVSDWVKESSVNDSGFSEAAADAIFASIMKLDSSLGGKILKSPLHFIGHSRGTVVNSEIIQRLGYYYPSKQNIQMTTLDVHDAPQASLDLEVKKVGSILAALNGTSLSPCQIEEPTLKSRLACWATNVLEKILDSRVFASLTNAVAGLVDLQDLHYADFRDPIVQVWSNVEFADNYFQDLGRTTQTFTPNGYSLPAADINLRLHDDQAGLVVNGRAGFTQDDFVDIESLLNKGLGGIAGPHSRVWKWYAGTIDLSLEEFEDERIWRRLFDSNFEVKLGQGIPVSYNETPWYQALEGSSFTGTVPTVSEGIGTGWFYSQLGGGVELRATGGERVAVTYDNSLPDDYGDTRYHEAVPSLFNGDFESGTLWQARYDHFDDEFVGSERRFPSYWGIPGWFFHNGDVSETGNYATEFLQNEGDNTYLLLDSANPEIIHNRFFAADDVHGIRFSIQPETSSGTLSVRVFKDGASEEVVVVDLGQLEAGVGEDVYVPYPMSGAYDGLSFEITGGALLLDDVELDRGVLMLDASGDPDDGYIELEVDPEFINGETVRETDLTFKVDGTRRVDAIFVSANRFIQSIHQVGSTEVLVGNVPDATVPIDEPLGGGKCIVIATGPGFQFLQKFHDLSSCYQEILGDDLTITDVVNLDIKVNRDVTGQRSLQLNPNLIIDAAEVGFVFSALDSDEMEYEVAHPVLITHFDANPADKTFNFLPVRSGEDQFAVVQTAFAPGLATQWDLKVSGTSDFSVIDGDSNGLASTKLLQQLNTNKTPQDGSLQLKVKIDNGFVRKVGSIGIHGEVVQERKLAYDIEQLMINLTNMRASSNPGTIKLDQGSNVNSSNITVWEQTIRQAVEDELEAMLMANLGTAGVNIIDSRGTSADVSVQYKPTPHPNGSAGISLVGLNRTPLEQLLNSGLYRENPWVQLSRISQYLRSTQPISVYLPAIMDIVNDWTQFAKGLAYVIAHESGHQYGLFDSYSYGTLRAIAKFRNKPIPTLSAGELAELHVFGKLDDAGLMSGYSPTIPLAARYLDIYEATLVSLSLRDGRSRLIELFDRLPEISQKTGDANWDSQAGQLSRWYQLSMLLDDKAYGGSGTTLLETLPFLVLTVDPPSSPAQAQLDGRLSLDSNLNFTNLQLAPSRATTGAAPIRYEKTQLSLAGQLRDDNFGPYLAGVPLNIGVSITDDQDSDKYFWKLRNDPWQALTSNTFNINASNLLPGENVLTVAAVRDGVWLGATSVNVLAIESVDLEVDLQLANSQIVNLDTNEFIVGSYPSNSKLLATVSGAVALDRIASQFLVMDDSSGSEFSLVDPKSVDLLTAKFQVDAIPNQLAAFLNLELTANGKTVSDEETIKARPRPDWLVSSNVELPFDPVAWQYVVETTFPPGAQFRLSTDIQALIESYFGRDAETFVDVGIRTITTIPVDIVHTPYLRPVDARLQIKILGSQIASFNTPLTSDYFENSVLLDAETLLPIGGKVTVGPFAIPSFNIQPKPLTIAEGWKIVPVFGFPVPIVGKIEAQLRAMLSGTWSAGLQFENTTNGVRLIADGTFFKLEGVNTGSIAVSAQAGVPLLASVTGQITVDAQQRANYEAHFGAEVANGNIVLDENGTNLGESYAALQVCGTLNLKGRAIVLGESELQFGPYSLLQGINGDGSPWLSLFGTVPDEVLKLPVCGFARPMIVGKQIIEIPEGTPGEQIVLFLTKTLGLPDDHGVVVTVELVEKVGNQVTRAATATKDFQAKVYQQAAQFKDSAQESFSSFVIDAIIDDNEVEEDESFTAIVHLDGLPSHIDIDPIEVEIIIKDNDGGGSEGEPNSTPQLSTNYLNSMSDAALKYWQSQAKLRVIPSIHVSVTDLPTGTLADTVIESFDEHGLPSSVSIRVDQDASGNGWFLDETPYEHSEFTPSDLPGVLRSKNAPNSYDLWTVMVHEVGHSLGLSRQVPLLNSLVAVGKDDRNVIKTDVGSVWLTSDLDHVDAKHHSDSILAEHIQVGTRHLASSLDFGLLTTIQAFAFVSSDSTELLSQASGVGSGIEDSWSRFNVFRENVQDALLQGTHLAIEDRRFETLTNSTQSPWYVSGTVNSANGIATISESENQLTDISQTFVVPAATRRLSFSLSNIQLGSQDGQSPGDAMEVALLDAMQTTSLRSEIPGLEGSDALLSIQADGRVLFAPQVSIVGVNSGDIVDLNQTLDVAIDLRDVAPGTIASLYFDLIGFGDNQSHVDVSKVKLEAVLSWQNELNPRDTTGDGFIVPQDVLVIINELNHPTISINGVLPEITDAIGPPPFYDVNDDGYVVPMDALIIINYLNALGGGEGEDSLDEPTV
ncbi:MAG: putative Ig domain-containing protein, partial [Planctomycetales bacterium]|nr:putative Ig domain-containing protein [Planctomycetales bacterium]